jgi:hypothetical protein
MLTVAAINLEVVAVKNETITSDNYLLVDKFFRRERSLSEY